MSVDSVRWCTCHDCNAAGIPQEGDGRAVIVFRERLTCRCTPLLRSPIRAIRVVRGRPSWVPRTSTAPASAGPESGNRSVVREPGS